MAKKTNYFPSLFILFLTFLLFFGIAEKPDNSDFRKELNSVSPNQVVIIFNSGGWGNTPPEEAFDFTPIVKGIQRTLKELGYESVVIPYKRTKDSLGGRIQGVKEFFNSFPEQSSQLAADIVSFQRKNPETKIIMTGLSNGAAFVNNVIKKIPSEFQSNVLAIEIGIPFWEQIIFSDNILFLNNRGDDSLSGKKISNLILPLLESPFRWASAKISGRELSFSQALEVPGHQYFWRSSHISLPVMSFLNEKIPTFSGESGASK